MSNKKDVADVKDWLASQDVIIPKANLSSATEVQKSIKKKQRVLKLEKTVLLDCPLPRFYALTPIKCGYLTKQGHTFRSWKRRLVALEGHYLYYYSDETDKIPKGVLLLTDCEVEEEPTVAKERKSSCFSVKATRSWNVSTGKVFVNRKYYFCIHSNLDLSDWLALLSVVSSGNPPMADEPLF